MAAVAALVPVLLFLAALYLLDSFRLVPLRSVLASLAAGAAAALVTLWVHALTLPGIDPLVASRYVAPLTEEFAKGLVIVVLIAGGRVGFIADIAVKGFAVGAGFAVVENVTYLRALADAPLPLWIVRGVGTAMLHGATTAIFGMIAKALADRPRQRAAAAVLPGFAAAVGIHSAFNHVLLPPVVQTLVLLMMLPMLILIVFDRSDRATREWIGAGLDLDLEVLQLVASGHFPETRLGRHLMDLRPRFGGPAVANMYCLLRLELELAVQAKAVVLARSAGLDLPADADLEAALAERRYLHRSIGRTGVRALEPLQVTSRRDHWHRRLLRQARVGVPRRRARATAASAAARACDRPTPREGGLGLGSGEPGGGTTMAERDGISERGRAHEEDYFRKKDRELIEKMRQAGAAEQARSALGAATGLRDPALLGELQELGFTPETVVLLPLVPIVQMAWAEGGVTDPERRLIVDLARTRGIAEGSAADRELAAWLDRRPAQDVFTRATRLIRAMFATPSEARTDMTADDVIKYCESIAAASGGLFGIGRISADERATLAKIAAELKGR